LINAYKTSASLCLQLTPIVQKPVLINYELEFDYTLMNDVMLILKKYNCSIITNEMQLFIKMLVGIPKSNEEICLHKLKEIHQLQMTKV